MTCRSSQLFRWGRLKNWEVDDWNFTEYAFGCRLQVLAGDDLGRIRFDGTHECLASDFYLFNMAMRVKPYVAHCPQCQAKWTPGHRSFGGLRFVLTPAAPLRQVSS